MARSWYYLHEGERHGPFSAEEIKRLALAGALHPNDRLWPEGADPGTAIEARAAVDPAAAVSTAVPAPDWLSDVWQTARTGPHPPPPVPTELPDWLNDLRQAEAPPAEPTLPGPEAPALVAAGPPSPPESPDEAFRLARVALGNWVDQDENRCLVLEASIEVIRRDAELQEVFRRYQHLGQELTDRLWRHLEFLLENRRKYYAARPG